MRKPRVDVSVGSLVGFGSATLDAVVDLDSSVGLFSRERFTRYGRPSLPDEDRLHGELRRSVRPPMIETRIKQGRTRSITLRTDERHPTRRRGIQAMRIATTPMALGLTAALASLGLWTAEAGQPTGESTIEGIWVLNQDLSDEMPRLSRERGDNSRGSGGGRRGAGSAASGAGSEERAAVGVAGAEVAGATGRTLKKWRRCVKPCRARWRI